jgi:hypothetical protein
MERIHFVGNVLIDCLLAQLPKTEKREHNAAIQRKSPYVNEPEVSAVSLMPLPSYRKKGR